MEKKYVLISQYPLMEGVNKAGAMIICRDLTEKEKTEEALRESERRYRKVIDNAADIIFQIDIQGNFTFLNPVATKITEYSEEELIGMNYMKLVHSDDVTKVSSYFEKMFQENIPEGKVQMRIVTKSGKKIWLEAHISALKEGKKVVEWQSVARDITVQKEAEDALKERMDELERFQKVTVKRELQMIELKKRIHVLEKRKKRS